MTPAVPGKDIYQARADLATAQVTLLQNQDSARTSVATLKNAMGLETDATVQPAPLTLTGGLPPLPDAGPERSLDDFLAVAYGNRPDLRQQAATVDSNRLSVKQARIGAGVQVQSNYQYVYQPQNDNHLLGTGSQFFLTGTYPLFDAGAARAAVRNAQAVRDASQDQFIQVRQNVRLDVEQAFVQRSEALQRTRLAQTAVQAAQVNFDAATAARKEGIGTVVDITQAQVTLTQAQNQYVTAIYDFYTADARLQKAIGLNDTGR